MNESTIVQFFLYKSIIESNKMIIVLYMLAL